MKIRIGILLEEYEYGIKIGEYLSNNNHDFDIKIIENKKSLVEKFAKDFDIILSDSISYIDLIRSLISDINFKLLYLSSNYEQHRKQEELDCVVLEKYKSLKIISSEIRYQYSIVNGSINIKPIKENIKVYLVTSAAGGTGKSSISIATARDFAVRLSKSVLYLNFETLQIFDSYFSQMNVMERNISDYLYYLFKDKRELKKAVDIKSYLYKDQYGVNTFSPSNGKNELIQLSIEDLKYFLDSICESGEFEYLIIDFSSECFEFLNFLHSYCTCILLINDNSYVSKNKNNKLLELINNNLSFNEENKIMEIYNKHEMSEFKNEEKIYIENDTGSIYSINNKLEISMHGNFYFGIRNITDCLLKYY